MRTWKASGFVIESLPDWALREIPMARNAWAPDISLLNGRYHLYYSVSSFGSRLIGTRLTSCSRPRSRSTGCNG